MSRPRPVLPGKTILLTRRCAGRAFKLKPDKLSTNAFWYILGYCAKKYDLQLHATLAMSNHVHTVLTDPHGLYPCFLRDFHALLARCLNAHRGDWEHFWDPKQTSAVELANPQAVLDKITYTLTNPVKDHLVAKARQWPGATSLQAQLHNRSITATRPKHFFRSKEQGGSMPETISIVFRRPNGFDELSDKQWQQLLREQIDEAETVAREERSQSGRSVVTPRKVLAQSHKRTPWTKEERRTLSPRVACKDKWRRIECLQRNKAWQAAYDDARKQWLTGLQATFPAGAWFVVQHCGAKAEQPASVEPFS